MRPLPVWDNLLISHRDRSRVIAPEHHEYVLDKDGNATSTVLLDGRVAGVWHLEDTPEKVVVKVAPLTARLERRPRQIEAEAMRIALMLGVAKLEVHLVGPPPSLRIGPRNLFLSTLKDR